MKLLVLFWCVVFFTSAASAQSLSELKLKDGRTLTHAQIRGLPGGNVAIICDQGRLLVTASLLPEDLAARAGFVLEPSQFLPDEEITAVAKRSLTGRGACLSVFAPAVAAAAKKETETEREHAERTKYLPVLAACGIQVDESRQISYNPDNQEGTVTAGSWDYSIDSPTVDISHEEYEGPDTAGSNYLGMRVPVGQSISFHSELRLRNLPLVPSRYAPNGVYGQCRFTLTAHIKPADYERGKDHIQLVAVVVNFRTDDCPCEFTPTDPTASYPHRTYYFTWNGSFEIAAISLVDTDSGVEFGHVRFPIKLTRAISSRSGQ
jgi:hypothetical protein